MVVLKFAVNAEKVKNIPLQKIRFFARMLAQPPLDHDTNALLDKLVTTLASKINHFIQASCNAKRIQNLCPCVFFARLKGLTLSKNIDARNICLRINGLFAFGCCL